MACPSCASMKVRYKRRRSNAGKHFVCLDCGYSWTKEQAELVAAKFDPSATRQF